MKRRYKRCVAFSFRVENKAERNIGIMEKGRLKALGTAQEIKTLTHTDSLEAAFLALTEEETE